MRKGILDSSSARDLMECPRRYYFIYVRGFKPVKVNINLHHGSCTHEAMDVLWRLKSPEAALLAYNEMFATAGMEDDEVNAAYPKSPRRMPEVLDAYMERWGDWLNSIELLHSELPVSLVVGKDRVVGSRLDKVFRRDGRLWVSDHKTTKTFKNNWSDTFLPDFQMETYSYISRRIWPDFVGVLVDGLLFQKADRAEFEKKEKVPVSSGWFRRVPLELDPGMEETYLHELTLLFEEQERWFAMLAEERDLAQAIGHSQTLYAFPRRTKSCHYYSGCPYRHLCFSQPNPEKYTKPPLGFKEEFWEPFDLDEIDKNAVTTGEV